MKQNNYSTGRNLRWYMRYMHNKIGFFIVGLLIIYALSGILQTYRDTDLLKHEVVHEQQLPSHLTESQIGANLRIRDFKIIRTAGDVLYFRQGTYNQETGQAKYSSKEWYSWVIPFTELHKVSSRNAAHYFTTLFALTLLFMSVSAFWIFKPGTKPFSSGVFLTAAGIVASVVLLIIN